MGEPTSFAVRLVVALLGYMLCGKVHPLSYIEP